MDGNPLLRVLRPSSLKGMNASDRAPSGLFSIPVQVDGHFQKVKDTFNLCAQCWDTSYIPLVMNSQKWSEEDPNLTVNDVIYFMMDDSVMKAD